MTPLCLSAMTAVSAMGCGLAAMRRALHARHCPLRPCDFPHVRLAAHIGRVDGVEEVRLPQGLEPFDCRNNRLALLALEGDQFIAAVQAAVRRHGAMRVGVVMGTSTSGIQAGEEAYRLRDPATGSLPGGFDFVRTQDLFSSARFVRELLGLKGPAFVVSNACASSAKAFADAALLLAVGLCDAVVVGGADSLCGITLYGFNSLELLSPGPCRPFAADRDGISIGEAAAFALLERVDPGQAGGEMPGVFLLGHGSSTDAHHMSAPHPEGAGAVASMRAALAAAGLPPAAVDYVNFHGTGTRGNDAVEDRAVAELFCHEGKGPACSSTKGWTGHTLGASGALEAVVTALALREGTAWGCLNVDVVDPACRSDIRTGNATLPLRVALSNSFGFGGSNCSLVLGLAPVPGPVPPEAGAGA